MSDSLHTVQTLYANLAQGNLSKILALLDPQATIHKPESLPYGGTYKGRDGFISLMTAVYKTWSDFQVIPQSIIASNGMVVVQGEWIAKIKGAENTLDMPFLHLWKINNDLITEIWLYYWDTTRVLNYLGGTSN
jgi:ketosteroid isomerase-like protein